MDRNQRLNTLSSAGIGLQNNKKEDDSEDEDKVVMQEKDEKERDNETFLTDLISKAENS